jgi:uncharacterized protein YkwD
LTFSKPLDGDTAGGNVVACRTTSVIKLVLVTGALLLATCVVPPASAAPAAEQEASTSRTLTQAARRNAGRSVLRLDAHLAGVARAQSQQMAARGSIFHNTHLGEDASVAGVDWHWLGENVGVGPDAGLIHDGFMNSPSHREVLLRADATAFAIAAAFGKDGRLYITQVFAKLVAPEPVAAAAAMRAAPEAPPAPSMPKKIERTPVPNAVIDGVVAHGLSELTAGRPGGTTRSGLRAS